MGAKSQKETARNGQKLDHDEQKEAANRVSERQSTGHTGSSWHINF